MKKSHLNLVIDAIMLIVMMAIIGMGLLVKYILLSGQQKWEKYGENFEFTMFGLDRHEWGQLHFILGLVLAGLLLLHIILHWKMIGCIYKKFIKNRVLRTFIALLILFLSIGFLIFPFFINPSIEKNTNNKQHYQERLKKELLHPNTTTEDTNKTQNVTLPLQHEAKHHSESSNVEVMGSMTLKHISDKYGVPCTHLKQALNIPASTSNNERLGRLRKQKGFTMTEVEQIIVNYQKQKNNDKEN